MKEMKSAILLGTAYPYRGGLAGTNQTLTRTFIQEGIACRIITFTLQYPSFLFPGSVIHWTYPRIRRGCP